MLYFSRLLCKLGLEHVKFHAIRHTFATRAIENGIDVSTVSGILGHADVTTTTHFYVRPREKAMNRAMQSITPIIQPPTQSAPSALRRVQERYTEKRSDMYAIRKEKQTNRTVGQSG